MGTAQLIPPRGRWPRFVIATSNDRWENGWNLWFWTCNTGGRRCSKRHRVVACVLCKRKPCQRYLVFCCQCAYSQLFSPSRILHPKLSQGQYRFDWPHLQCFRCLFKLVARRIGEHHLSYWNFSFWEHRRRAFIMSRVGIGAGRWLDTRLLILCKPAGRKWRCQDVRQNHGHGTPGVWWRRGGGVTYRCTCKLGTS